jgi:predicted RNA-binding protein YlqC (UPF0109 family)
MKMFIEYVVKALVDHPEQVDVKEVDGERVVVFEVRLNPTDIGKVIGKSGRTITAIRTLLTSAAAKHNKRAMLEIIEPEGGRAASGSGEPPSAEHAD